MKPAELLDAINAAGASLVVEDGKARIRGAKIPDELVAAVKASREAVIAEWERRQEQAKDRYGEVPREEVPTFGQHANLTLPQRELVVGYVFRQPRTVHAWIMMRAQRYHELGAHFSDCEWKACVDCLCWQRHADPKTAVAWLEGIAAGTLTGLGAAECRSLAEVPLAELYQMRDAAEDVKREDPSPSRRLAGALLEAAAQAAIDATKHGN
jgi:hypothetical protein